MSKSKARLHSVPRPPEADENLKVSLRWLQRKLGADVLKRNSVDDLAKRFNVKSLSIVWPQKR